MSQDPPDDAPITPAPPSLNKEPAAPPAGASIWQPLDGSAPRLPPPPDPGLGAWSQPHAAGAVPPPQQVAAAYAASAQNAGVFTLAGWGQRLVAFIVDSLLFGVIVFAVVIPAAMALGLTQHQAMLFPANATASVPRGAENATALWVLFIAARIALGVLPAVFLAKWNGQTPGKRLMHLRVMTGSGDPLTLQVAMLRELLGRAILVQLVTVLTFGVGFLLNYLWPLWDSQRRTGYDALANTRVVVVPQG